MLCTDREETEGTVTIEGGFCLSTTACGAYGYPLIDSILNSPPSLMFRDKTFGDSTCGCRVKPQSQLSLRLVQRVQGIRELNTYCSVLMTFDDLPGPKNVIANNMIRVIKPFCI